MTLLDELFALAVVVAFAAGVRSTWRLWRRYADASPILDARERLLLRSFVIVSVLITAAAGFYGFLAARRLMGYEPLEWVPLVSVIIAIAVLLIPVGLDAAITRIVKR
jgi:hypothetical protein